MEVKEIFKNSILNEFLDVIEVNTVSQEFTELKYQRADGDRLDFPKDVFVDSNVMGRNTSPDISSVLSLIPVKKTLVLEDNILEIENIPSKSDVITPEMVEAKAYQSIRINAEKDFANYIIDNACRFNGNFAKDEKVKELKVKLISFWKRFLNKIRKKQVDTGYIKVIKGKNSHEMIRRVFSTLLIISNLTAVRSRRGPGQFAMVNTATATALQDMQTYKVKSSAIIEPQYGLYEMGAIAGLRIIVNPFMRWDDTRMFVWRKDEPSVLLHSRKVRKKIKLNSSKETYAYKSAMYSPIEGIVMVKYKTEKDII